MKGLQEIAGRSRGGSGLAGSNVGSRAGLAGEVSAPIIELRGVTKSYGAVAALKGIDFEVRAGEVVGLVGDNGAGKSTLMKVVAGAIQPDDGEILIDGSRVHFSSTRESRRRGIEMLYQDLALCDDLDVAVNFYLGRAPTQFGLVRIRRMHAARRAPDPAPIYQGSRAIPFGWTATVVGDREGSFGQATRLDPRRADCCARSSAVARCSGPRKACSQQQHFRGIHLPSAPRRPRRLRSDCGSL
jgi:ABC-type multidrug transport system fused ATPase/permease subunit